MLPRPADGQLGQVFTDRRRRPFRALRGTLPQPRDARAGRRGSAAPGTIERKLLDTPTPVTAPARLLCSATGSAAGLTVGRQLPAGRRTSALRGSDGRGGRCPWSSDAGVRSYGPNALANRRKRECSNRRDAAHRLPPSYAFASGLAGERKRLTRRPCRRGRSSSSGRVKTIARFRADHRASSVPTWSRLWTDLSWMTGVAAASAPGR